MEINKKDYDKFLSDYKKLEESLDEANEINKTLCTIEPELLEKFSRKFIDTYFKVIDRITLKEVKYFKITKIHSKKDVHASLFVEADVLEFYNKSFTLQSKRVLYFEEIFRSIKITKSEYDAKIIEKINEIGVLSKTKDK